MANSIGMKSDNYSKMLSAEDVKFLSSKGVQFGSHSHTHPILTEIEKDQVVFEMQHSKEILENLTGKSVDIFAYPNGIWNEETEQMAKDCGFKYFLLTEDKINYLTTNTIQKHRYKRVNQYHRTLVEALSHIYGTTAFLRKLLGR
jgi:peptidoglycan/xylan/chitin deacetylase (PgdA/CDA1 family)